MLNIDISFKLNDIDFAFNTQVKRGDVYTFEVGEPILADKLLWVLTGLDKGYSGKIEGEGVCWNASSWNNVLALGDPTMFVRGSVRRNIYKALRVRADKKTAMARTEEIIEKYGLQVLAGLNVKLLSDEELLRVAVARADYRKIALVVWKKSADAGEIDLSKWADAYILTIVYNHPVAPAARRPSIKEGNLGAYAKEAE